MAHHASALAAREIVYLCNLMFAAVKLPVFLLLDLRTVWEESTPLQRFVRLAMYTLTPHNYLALCCAARFPAPLWKRHQQIAGCHAGIQGAGNGSANIAIQCMDNHRLTGRFLHTSCFGPAIADLRVPAPHSVAHPRSRVAIPYDRPRKPCLHSLWQRCEGLRRAGAFLLDQAHPTHTHVR